MNCNRPAVTALAFNHESPGPQEPQHHDLRLAVGRSNGDIEIWLTRRWTLEFVLPGAEGREIEDLTWCQGRLFSCGASDSITEWNLFTGRPARNFRLDAGAIWALDPSPNGQFIAAACESGSVVVLDVSGGEIEVAKRLQSCDASLASITWKNDEEIVAGGADARLRVWSLKNGRIIGTMKVDKSRSGEGTIVWAVKTLAGEQIVSGDSNGTLKTWDGRNLALQQSLQAHEADILCLATDAQRETLFSSGLDQKVVCTRMTDPKKHKWTIMNSQVAHSHDIRAMALYDGYHADYLVAGGKDNTFVVSSTDFVRPQSHHRAPFSKTPPSIDIQSGYLVEWHDRTMRLWSLKPTRKLVLEMKVSGDEYISGCALIGSSVLITTPESTRQFKIHDNQVEPLDSKIPGGKVIKPVGDNKHAVLVTVDSTLLLLNVSTDGCQTSEFDEPPDLRSAPGPLNAINMIQPSPDGVLVAAAKRGRLIELYEVSTARHVGSLPALPNTITAIGWRTKENLVVATIDMEIWEFDVNQLMLTLWSRKHSSHLPSKLTKQTTVCLGLFPDFADSRRLWLWGPRWLALLDFASLAEPKPKNKRRANSDDESDAEDENDNESGLDAGNFWLTTQYRPLFFAGILDGDLVVVEKPPQTYDTKPFWSNRHIDL